MRERMNLPKAELEHLFYIEVDLEHVVHEVGDVGRGELYIFPIKGGRFDGKISGDVMDVGADWNLFYRNGLDCVDTRYLLKTDDGALISLTTIGRCLMSQEQAEAMDRGEYVDPADYYFRQHLLFETSDERYDWLNKACCFGVLASKDAYTIVYDAYMVK